jgi:DNA-binding transcriptional LysR family regulator
MDQLTGFRIFARVVELGSFSKAADDLAVSQSTVTKHIAWLESHLGARLLNRNTRGISLTEGGGLYYERCKAILKDVDDADAAVGHHSGALTGTLRISTSVAFGRRIVAPMLIEFMQLEPQLKIDITCEDAYVDLVSRGIEVALRMGRLADSSLGGRYIGSNPWVMVASPGYLAEHPAPRTPKELNDHDCIVYSSVQGDAVWQIRSREGEIHAVVVNGRLRSNNLSTLLSAVQLNLGIAILPTYVASSSLKSGQTVRVLEDYILPEQELHAVFPSPKFVPQKVTAFIHFLTPRFKGSWWDSDQRAGAMRQLSFSQSE